MTRHGENRLKIHTRAAYEKKKSTVINMKIKASENESRIRLNIPTFLFNKRKLEIL